MVEGVDMAKLQVVANFPDILGTITRGTRVNIDMVQCALTVRPIQVPSGQTFELVLLVQNACDVNVDVALKADLPSRDLAKNKDPFTPKPEKLLIGLRPAEVGVVVLPVESAQGTQPGKGYTAALELKVKAVPKEKRQKPQLIRAEAGGGPVKAQALSGETVAQMKALRALRWSVESRGKKIQSPFLVVPPAVAGLTTPKADWISLWTMADYADDFTVAQSVWESAQNAIAQLTRDQIFMPLLKATQERFQACGYPLLPPEAIYITKSLVLVLERPVTPPTPENRQAIWPRWFSRLCRTLAQEAALADQPDVLAAQFLYADLMHDAVIQGFSAVSAVTNENFGSPAEANQYASDLVTALGQQQPLDITRAYLPLVMAGVVANTRVTMPREQVRETVFTLSKALEKRLPEKTQENAFIFDITNTLVEHALDAT
jgi:hypothetical protein